MEAEPNNVLSILSLCVAMLAVVTGPFVAWTVSKRQSDTSLYVVNKQIIAPMRQTWIEGLRKTIAEILSTLLWFYISEKDEVTKTDDDEDYDELLSHEAQKVERKLLFLISKVELMLNSNEEDHISLLNNLNEARRALFSTGNDHVKFYGYYEESIADCKKVLKREWERVKHEV